MSSNTSLYIIVLFLFILLGIVFYYTKAITPIPTTSVPTTSVPTTSAPTKPVPTTPLPTNYPYSSLTRAFEGTWISYNYGGNEFGPINIRAIGENKFYISGGNNIYSDNLRVLTVDPNTLMCSLPERSMSNNFGTALIYGNKVIKIHGNKGITFTRSNDIPNVTVSPTSKDPFEGVWMSYKVSGNEYGPVTILSTGGNSYYIYGENISSDSLRVLTVDPITLSCSLPEDLIYNFGTPFIYEGKAIKIDGNGITFKRSNVIPNITASPTSTNPFEGTWSSYKYGGNEYGPVNILSTGGNSFYIYGGNLPSDNFRVLTVDPTTLLCSLPQQNINNFGTAIIVEGKVILIDSKQNNSNQNSGISFRR
jgi:hypothetical protein